MIDQRCFLHTYLQRLWPDASVIQLSVSSEHRWIGRAALSSTIRPRPTILSEGNGDGRARWARDRHRLVDAGCTLVGPQGA